MWLVVEKMGDSYGSCAKTLNGLHQHVATKPGGYGAHIVSSLVRTSAEVGRSIRYNNGAKQWYVPDDPLRMTRITTTALSEITLLKPE